MRKINNYLIYYLIILLGFSFFFLYTKHQVGNDSTISEWLINYEGGFTKRGLVGQFAIETARFFGSDIRWVVFLFQSFVCTCYFILLYNLLIKLKSERVIILSIFSPIFILYPVAEIEVLARKEIIVFSLFLIYLFVPRNSNFKSFSLIIFSVLSILIWEPIIFFYPLLFIYEIIDRKIEKLNFQFFKIFITFIPSLIITLIIVFNPLSKDEHETMAFVLKNEFNQSCYMSCALLLDKSTIIQQFEGNFGKYSLEVFIRYFLIFFIGFYPLNLLIKNSSLSNKNIIVSYFFKTLLQLFWICLLPVTVLFAMGYDWGRWVNITYVFLVLIYFKLLIDGQVEINFKNLKYTFLYKIKGKTYVIFFIIFCFGWNPKTVITGDVASFPGYRIPYKVFKILNN